MRSADTAWSSLSAGTKLRAIALFGMLLLPLGLMFWAEMFWPWVLLDAPGVAAYAAAILAFAAFNFALMLSGQGARFGEKRGLAAVIVIALGMGLLEGPYLLRQSLTIMPFRDLPAISEPRLFLIDGASNRSAKVYVEMAGEEPQRRVAIYTAGEAVNRWRDGDGAQALCIEIAVQQGRWGYRRAYSSSIFGFRVGADRLVPDCAS